MTKKICGASGTFLASITLLMSITSCNLTPAKNSSAPGAAPRITPQPDQAAPSPTSSVPFKNVIVNVDSLMRTGNANASFDYQNGNALKKIEFTTANTQPRSQEVLFTSEKDPEFTLSLICDDNECAFYRAVIHDLSMHANTRFNRSTYRDLHIEFDSNLDSSNILPSIFASSRATGMGDLYLTQIEGGDSSYRFEPRMTDGSMAILEGEFGTANRMNVVHFNKNQSSDRGSPQNFNVNASIEYRTLALWIELTDDSRTQIHVYQ